MFLDKTKCLQLNSLIVWHIQYYIHKCLIHSRLLQLSHILPNIDVLILQVIVQHSQIYNRNFSKLRCKLKKLFNIFLGKTKCLQQYPLLMCSTQFYMHKCYRLTMMRYLYHIKPHINVLFLQLIVQHSQHYNRKYFLLRCKLKNLFHMILYTNLYLNHHRVTCFPTHFYMHKGQLLHSSLWFLDHMMLNIGVMNIQLIVQHSQDYSRNYSKYRFQLKNLFHILYHTTGCLNQYSYPMR